jgi:hypothetical protein
MIASGKGRAFQSWALACSPLARSVVVANRESEGVLLVRKTGETLYRVKDSA